MLRISVICAAALALSVPAAAVAQAQPKPLAALSGDAYTHANSGVTAPAVLEGLPRTKAAELESPELDVIFEWATRDSSEVVTLYVYRVPSGAVPVWFDRAIWAVEGRAIYGKATRAGLPIAFTPPRQASAAGMMAVWSLADSSYRTTALAIMPLGEWLVKLRISSRSLDAEGIAARLRRSIEAVGWPAKVPPAPTAVPVADCATPLRFSGPAKPAAQEMSDVLAGALIGVGSAAVPRTWCRDPAKLDSAGLYRPADTDDEYLLALSDAGRGISVHPATTLLLGNEKPKAARWSVDLVLPGQTVMYPAYDRLPPPDQLMTIIRGPARSSVTTWGAKRAVKVSPGAVRN